MSRDQVNVGLLGLGVVGSGVYRLLQEHDDVILQRAGLPVRVVRVAVRDWQKPREMAVPAELRAQGPAEVVDDPKVDVVVEVMGGVEPARELLLRAIAAGKSIVTANKELMARHGGEILDAAAATSVDVEFEAAAAGVIPIVRSLRESLEGDNLTEIVGILNGTTNYILTRMSREGLSLEAALAEAQRLGYAEPDPTADVEGVDPLYKIAILAAIAFGQRLNVDAAYREGIRHITATDIKYAADMGYCVKLLAIAKRRDSEVELRVHPALLPQAHPLAAVNEVYNAVFVRGEACGEVMLYGRGAGSLPTATAVVGDIISIARNLRRGATGRVLCTCRGQADIRPMERVASRNYIRMTVTDRPGVIGAIATIFGQEQVSIESVIQRGSFGTDAEIVWVTHEVAEQPFRRALERIAKLEAVEATSSVIRVEE